MRATGSRKPRESRPDLVISENFGDRRQSADRRQLSAPDLLFSLGVMYYDSSEEEEIVTVLMCSAIVSALAERKPSKKKRRWWVRPSLRSREVAGHASRLLPDLRSHDEEYFRE
ncbi:hypothetical protein HPB52_016198 [Rhipicephalus sanguineus]|uniref:Uncharacterized protein n=1 Tax=Rhipicephalus sanguineus TaxID=34632 RepID=A0A9D4Q3J1_RHISA|nr:hypothetical protein HPB52_016198 [Rhipicephalus sanguineus]